jgi:hypothetical protein
VEYHVLKKDFQANQQLTTDIAKKVYKYGFLK